MARAMTGVHVVGAVFERDVERADQLERGVGDADGDAGSPVGVGAEFGGADAGRVPPRSQQAIVGDVVGDGERRRRT